MRRQVDPRRKRRFAGWLSAALGGLALWCRHASELALEASDPQRGAILAEPCRVLYQASALIAVFCLVIWAALWLRELRGGRRRRLAREQGRCPSCGYDLRVASGIDRRCPECGETERHV